MSEREIILTSMAPQPRWLHMTGLRLGDVVTPFPEADFPPLVITALAQWWKQPKMWEIYSEEMPGPLVAHEDEQRYALLQGMRVARMRCMLCPKEIEHVYDLAKEDPPEHALCGRCGGKK